MSVILKPLTVEDLETFPADGHRYEIIAGDLMMSPAPTQRHQLILGLLYRLFDDAARASRAGRVYFSPVDVRFSQTDQVQPDLIFIRKARAGIYQGSTVDGPPDIVVEVLSPSNRSFDEVAKFRLFEAHGVPEYWIVDPAANAIRCFVLTNGAYLQVVNREGQPLPSSVLQGLTIDPEALFRDSDAYVSSN